MSGKKDIIITREMFFAFAFMAVISVLAIPARLKLYPYSSGDYVYCLEPWYNTIKSNGGFAALSEPIGNYTPPYFYCLAFLTYLPFEPLPAIKTLSCIFDFLLAVYCAKIIYLVTKDYVKTAITYSLALFLPTVILNSAFWAQCDGMYTAFLVMCIYYVLAKKDYAAIAMFGIAFSLKLQSIFIAPFLLILLLKKEVPFIKLWVFPLTFLLMMFPAILLGDNLTRILNIYFGQSQQYPNLTYNCANVWAFVSGVNNAEISSSSVLMTGAVCIMLIYYTLTKKSGILSSHRLVLTGTAMFALGVAFFLPHMHERYYFPAVIFTLLVSMADTKKFGFLVLMEYVSVMSYMPFLFGYGIPNWSILSGIAALVLYLLFKDYRNLLKEAG